MEAIYSEQIAKIKHWLKNTYNLKNFDCINITQYINTPFGGIICLFKPNVYQRIDQRYYEFEIATGEDGEPYIEGILFEIRLDLA